MDDLKDEDIFLTTIVERRGKKEDKALFDYYNRILDTGTYWVKANRIKNILSVLK